VNPTMLLLNCGNFWPCVIAHDRAGSIGAGQKQDRWIFGDYSGDPDLRPDDEHVRIHGKGGTVRTVLLDDCGYVALLKLYLARAECSRCRAALVSSGTSRRRSTSAGTEGAAQRFLVWHQVSQEAIAARLRFQVAGEHVPHRSVSAAPISSSAISAGGRVRPRRSMVRSMAEAALEQQPNGQWR
jgi:predicted transcriptional regulator